MEWDIKAKSKNCVHRYRSIRNEGLTNEFHYIACGVFIKSQPECSEINCPEKIK